MGVTGVTIVGIPAALSAKYAKRVGQGVLAALNSGKLPAPSVIRLIVLPLPAGASLEDIQRAFVEGYAQLRLDTSISSRAYSGAHDEATAHCIMLKISMDEEFLIERREHFLPVTATVAFALPLKGRFEDRTLETQGIMDEIDGATKGAFEIETLKIDGKTFLLVKLPCREGTREVDFTQQLVIAAYQEAKARTKPENVDEKYREGGFD